MGIWWSFKYSWLIEAVICCVQKLLLPPQQNEFLLPCCPPWPQGVQERFVPHVSGLAVILSATVLISCRATTSAPATGVLVSPRERGGAAAHPLGFLQAPVNRLLFWQVAIRLLWAGLCNTLPFGSVSHDGISHDFLCCLWGVHRAGRLSCFI